MNIIEALKTEYIRVVNPKGRWLIWEEGPLDAWVIYEHGQVLITTENEEVAIEHLLYQEKEMA